MPFRSGQRVSITRTSSANQRYGDTGTVISTGWDTSSRQTYNVRIDREFSRSATQRARGYDFTMRASQLARSTATASTTAAAPEPERNPTVAVGDRVTVTDVHYVDAASGQSGSVTQVSNSGLIRVRFDADIRNNTGDPQPADGWSVTNWTREVAAPAPATEWVDATEANAVEGARIRYRRTVGNVVTENDEGVIVVHGVDGATTRRIRMDTPRPGAGALSGTGDGAYHFVVLLSDIQVQVPATSAASVETAPDAPAVTFTPEQAALIKRVAERYTRDHGFSALAADVFAALGINDAPASKKLRFTVEYEVDVLPAVDGAELPNSASAAIVDAAARAASITGLLSETVRPVDGTIEAAVSRIRYVD